MSKPIGSGKSSFYGNDLAFLHNRHYSRFVTEAAPGAIRMLRAAGVKRGLICDLGCGGGQLSAALLKAGYEVVGVDLSPAMIRIARRQVKNARFLQGSIAEVNLPRCQAAFAVGEIVNYLGSRSGMARAFRNIFRALQPGGVFIFDIIGPLAGKMRKVGAHYAPEWALIMLQSGRSSSRSTRIPPRKNWCGKFILSAKQENTTAAPLKFTVWAYTLRGKLQGCCAPQASRYTAFRGMDALHSARAAEFFLLGNPRTKAHRHYVHHVHIVHHVYIVHHVHKPLRCSNFSVHSVRWLNVGDPGLPWAER